MAERYTRVFSQKGQFYCPGAPVVIEAGALLKDNQTGNIIAQVKFKNISPKTIKALVVKIYAKDISGADIEGVDNFQYLDLNVRRDTEFGSKTPIALPNAVARSFSCECVSAVFSDGTNWECEDDAVWTVLPAPVLLKNEIGAGLAEQYKRDTNSKAEFKVIDHADLWSCSCGAINSMNEEHCHACRTQKTALLAALNVETLRANKKKYDDAVAARQAEIEAEQQRRNQKNKKIGIIAGVALALLVAIVLLITKVIIPANDYKNANALLNGGEFIAAEQAFEALGTYKDSQTMVLECRYQRAQNHIEKKEYETAYNILGNMPNDPKAQEIIVNGKLNEANDYIQLGDYDRGYEILNSLGQGDKVNESVYQRATLALTEKDYDLANTLFISLGDYSDAQTQALEAKYQKACDFLNDKDYDAANPIFEELGDYKDSETKIHYHNYQVKDSKAASCMASGHNTYHCDGCQDEYTEQLAALGHSYSGATCTKASVCKRCGVQETGALGHSTSTGVCSRCKTDFRKTYTFTGSGMSTYISHRYVYIPDEFFTGRYKVTVSGEDGATFGIFDANNNYIDSSFWKGSIYSTKRFCYISVEAWCDWTLTITPV